MLCEADLPLPSDHSVLSSKTIDEIELEDSGRGLICKDPINMGNALFQLPLKIVIDKDKALEVSKRRKLERKHFIITHCAFFLLVSMP